MSNFIDITENASGYFNKIIYFYYILHLKETYKTNKTKLKEEIKEFFLKDVEFKYYKYLIKMDDEEKTVLT